MAWLGGPTRRIQSVTTSSQRVALVDGYDSFQLVAPDADVFVAFGDSAVDAVVFTANASTSSKYFTNTILSEKNVGIPKNVGGSVPTHVAFITASGTTDVTLLFGQGWAS
jgi:hypothetical protein